jgi:predicted CoA-binding protein
LGDIGEAVDTLTVYVSEQVSGRLEEAILRLAPKRVLFNPGAENPALRDSLEAAGISTREACTLVMLKTGQF